MIKTLPNYHLQRNHEELPPETPSGGFPLKSILRRMSSYVIFQLYKLTDGDRTAHFFFKFVTLYVPFQFIRVSDSMAALACARVRSPKGEGSES